MTLEEFARALATYCETLGGSVTRWFSTAQHNAAVGGDPRSLHRIGLAADVVYDVRPPIERARAVAEPLGLYVWPEVDHHHVRAGDRVWV